MKQIVVFDIETTGIDPANDRIVQIAYTKLNPATLEPLARTTVMLVNPGIPIPQGATDVHGISDEAVKDEPSFKAIGRIIAREIKDCDIGGYNSNSFDVPLIVSEFVRHGIPIPFDENTQFLDVLQMYRKLHSNKLTDVYERLTGKTLTGAHDAGADVNATVEVFKILVDTKRDIVGETSADWAAFCGGIGDDPYWFETKDGIVFFINGKNTGRKVSDCLDYCEWMMSRDFSIGVKTVLCRVHNAYLWESIAAGKFIYWRIEPVVADADDDDDLPF